MAKGLSAKAKRRIFRILFRVNSCTFQQSARPTCSPCLSFSALNTSTCWNAPPGLPSTLVPCTNQGAYGSHTVINNRATNKLYFSKKNEGGVTVQSSDGTVRLSVRSLHQHTDCPGAQEPSVRTLLGSAMKPLTSAPGPVVCGAVLAPPPESSNHSHEEEDGKHLGRNTQKTRDRRPLRKK